MTLIIYYVDAEKNLTDCWRLRRESLLSPSPPTIEGGGDRAFPQVLNYLSTLESWLMWDGAEVMLR
jgi:hypothetical protein